MINAAAASSAGEAASALSRDKDHPADAGLFARELNSRFRDLKTREDKVQASLQTLRAMFPRARFSVDGERRESAKTHDVVSSDRQVTVNADVLENMTADSLLSGRIEKLLEGFLGDGWEKNLLDSRAFEGRVWKSMNVQAEVVGYYESYQGAGGNGTASVANLRMAFNYSIDQNLDRLIGSDRRQQAETGAFDRSAFSGAASGGQSGLAGAWRVSGFFSAFSPQFFNLSGTGQQSGQSFPGLTGMQNRTMASLSVQLEAQMLLSPFGQSAPLSGLLGMFGLVDPLVLDLGGGGIDLRAAEDGVRFDMSGDGRKVKTGFIRGDDALLYLDADGNGLADGIHELFGDSQGHANGFEKLKRHDANGDGVIDEKDPVYSRLRLWRDDNGDGVNQERESMTLAEAGVASLDLAYAGNRIADGKGNLIGERSRFTRMDGTTGTMADVWFKTLN